MVTAILTTFGHSHKAVKIAVSNFVGQDLLNKTLIIVNNYSSDSECYDLQIPKSNSIKLLDRPRLRNIAAESEAISHSGKFIANWPISAACRSDRLSKQLKMVLDHDAEMVCDLTNNFFMAKKLIIPTPYVYNNIWDEIKLLNNLKNAKILVNGNFNAR